MSTDEEIQKERTRLSGLLFLCFFALGTIITGALFFIQFGPESLELRRRAVTSIYERVVIPADRGDILSHDMRLLATSIPTYEIRMDFGAQGLVDSTFNRFVGALSDSMAALFHDKSAAAYKQKFKNCYADRSNNRYERIAPRRINYMELGRLKRFPLFKLGVNKSGLVIEQINRRILPHGTMAQRTIGRVNLEGRGTGIEGSYDQYLKGTDGNTLMRKVSGSFRVPELDDNNRESVDGMDVVTTIDVDVQDVADATLRSQMEKEEADWGCAILMEVATGEVRAIANLSRYGDKYIEDYNHAIGTSLEPGSTLKLSSLITLIDDAGMRLSDKVDTGNGVAIINGTKVTDTHRCGVISLKEVFEQSSNVGFAQCVWKHYGKNPQHFVDRVRSLGLGDSLPIQIKGATPPSIMNTDNRYWSRPTLVMMAYGYAVRVTPMQILCLYNAVANQGKMVSPLFVTELRQYGKTVEHYQTQVMREKICSDTTLRLVRECLEGVITDGTARVLNNPYYRVAGKTGTAQIALGRHGYYDRSRGGRHYLGTVVGYFPADNPRYSCIVTIKTFHKDGSSKKFYGGSLSGPVFRAIADRVYNASVQWQPQVNRVKSPVKQLPSIKPGRAKEVKRFVKQYELPVGKLDIEGGGNDLSRVEVRGDTLTCVPLVWVTHKMPDLHGMGLRDAVYLLESHGLKVGFTGSGKVVEQSIAPDAEIKRGDTIHLTLQ